MFLDFIFWGIGILGDPNFPAKKQTHLFVNGLAGTRARVQTTRIYLQTNGGDIFTLVRKTPCKSRSWFVNT